ncbi:hypothetical protein PGC35_05170 [Psychrobacillus sp. PGGUH221]|uniref:hypothetical protein n=1 Tax=Psychrobacillus sp. PGGUH221 TaxID=3020058 RepID=UPI0035C6E869
MKFFREYYYLPLFIGLYMIYLLSDYSKNQTFNWVDNALQALFITAFYIFFTWAFSSDKSKKNK